MYKFRNSLISLGGLFALTVSIAPITLTSGQGKVQQIPISTFVNAQPPTQTIVFTDPASFNRLRFDIFGKRNAALGLNLGTAITGQVTVRDLGDGTEAVTVILHTRDALCWGFAGLPPIPAFGHSPVEVLGGAQASLGNGLMRLDFTQPADSPLPTFGQIFSGPPYVVDSLNATVMCQDGELRSGSGFADGTPGFAQTTQVGLFSTGVPSGCPPERDADCFPAEKVQFKPTDP